MSVTFSSDDLEKLARAVRLLTSPFDHPTVDGWRSAVNRHLRSLLRADSAGFLLPVADGLLLYSEEHDPEALAAYPDHAPPPLADGTPIELRMLELGVATLERGYGRQFRRYLASQYYNEFAAPNGAHDNLTAALSLGGMDPSSGAGLQFWHARPDGRRFGERETAILRLLFPAFRAGVEAHARWSRQRRSLLHTLDRLHQPALLCDAEGRVLHRTPALRKALQADPEAAALRGHLHAVAREVCEAGSGRLLLAGRPAAVPVRGIRTTTARYRIWGCLYGGIAAPGAAFVVVGLERLSAALPPHRELRERFGLTKRQAEVALLLAQRLSNREVAERLGISPHTALRHTEAVLAKLSLEDRRRVADRLQEDPAGPPQEK